MAVKQIWFFVFFWQSYSACHWLIVMIQWRTDNVPYACTDHYYSMHHESVCTVSQHQTVLVLLHSTHGHSHSKLWRQLQCSCSPHAVSLSLGPFSCGHHPMSQRSFKSTSFKLPQSISCRQGSTSSKHWQISSNMVSIFQLQFIFCFTVCDDDANRRVGWLSHIRSCVTNSDTETWRNRSQIVQCRWKSKPKKYAK